MAGDAYFRFSTNNKLYHTIKEEFEKAHEYNPFKDYDSVKWHDLIDHGIEISKQFPDILICIEKQLNDCDLFENPFSRYYFKNGKYYVQESTIMWNHFDESMLEEY